MSGPIASKRSTKNRYIQTIVQLCCQQCDLFLTPEKDLTTNCSPEALKNFIEQFYHHVSLDFIELNIRQKGIEALVERTLKAWQLLQHRSVGQDTTLVMAGDHTQTILMALNKDGPFLVDTLTLCLKTHGYHPHVIIHPVFTIARDQGGYLKKLLDHKSQDKKLKTSAESLIYVTIPQPLDAAQQQILQIDLQNAFRQVVLVAADFQPMRAIVQTVLEHYQHLANKEASSVIQFLEWLNNNHFVYLGYRYCPFENKAGGAVAYGLCRDPAFLTEIQANRVPVCDFQIGGDSGSKQSLLRLLKHSKVSGIHRDLRLESMQILQFDKQGQTRGYHEFFGIYSRHFFTHPPLQIPVLKDRLLKVLDAFGLSPDWHDGRVILDILNSIPVDEILYFSAKDLLDLSQKLFEYPNHLHVFSRFDSFHRSVTLLIYVPSARYHSEVIQNLRNVVSGFLGGKLIRHYLLIDDFYFVRLGVVVLLPEKFLFKPLDLVGLESQLNELSWSWSEQFVQLLGNEEGRDCFPLDYQHAFTPQQALKDWQDCCKISQDRSLVLQMMPLTSGLAFKIFHKDSPLTLSQLMPIFDGFGLKALTEQTFKLLNGAGESVWLHCFICEGDPLSPDCLHHLIETFTAVWFAKAENDLFNQLVIDAGLSLSQVVLFRAYYKALKQMGMTYSLSSVADVLKRYPAFVQRLCHLFSTRFNPAEMAAQDQQQRLCEEYTQALDHIKIGEHDRILRRFLNVILATVRTNFYQQQPYLSFKFACNLLAYLPKPIPLYEIFVYSPNVEACHLRGGLVARGGIRWSDRIEDFRAEILSLMKTQTVKNAVIVPMGSKGGFVCKRYESLKNAGASSSDLRREVVEGYQTFMQGLLDITDNFHKGSVIKPAETVCYDEDDPYLVVAADKGTASFSDIANQVSTDYNFWLGDAFASGGSYGYDHKKMAITARGAWVSVRRHFYELGFDCQTQPFTVVGIGDMAGDVFGNGMLQSKTICLIAAFNHQHIFLDPLPDPDKAYAERQRLFNMPNSSWADYDLGCIAEGGGVFERTAKFIPLSCQVRQALNLDAKVKEMPPEDLIKHILMAPVDLLWFGGIGTFVKSSAESHLEAQDSQNDMVRIDADKVRARVIGEGANLGMTQHARIEYALNGGRLNTDAIDNSAGVDCSDHEVNLKILFLSLSHSHPFDRAQRDQLLKQMTEEVADLVLIDNLNQTLAISLEHYLSSSVKRMIRDVQNYQRVIEFFECQPELHFNRNLEALPTYEDFKQRQLNHLPITRPERATVMAYTKIYLRQRLLTYLQKNLKDFDFWQQDYYAYFPLLIQKNFKNDLDQHPLKEQILSTLLANGIVNVMGPCWPILTALEQGIPIEEVVLKFYRAFKRQQGNVAWQSLAKASFCASPEPFYAQLGKIRAKLSKEVR